MRVAVLGAGPGAQAHVVALCQAGHDVSIWHPGAHDTEHAKLRAIRDDGIHAVGAVTAHVRPRLATKDIAEAVDGAEAIVAVTPARAHRPIAEALAPLVTAAQTIVLSPGRTGGAFEVRTILARAGRSVAGVAEVASNPFTCRLRGPNEVFVAERKRAVGVAALPASRTAAIVELFGDSLPLVARPSVLDTGFENIGAVFHVVGMLLSAAPVERAGLEIYYRDAITPAVARVMEATDAERVRTARAYGVSVPTALELSKARYPRLEGGLFGIIHGNPAYMAIGGVDGLVHRYLIDDLPMSVAPLVGLARAAGEAVPLHEGLLAIGSALLGEDYARTGRTMEAMGLAGMDVRAVLRSAGVA